MPAVNPRGQTGYVCPKGRSMQDACDRWELLTLVQELRKELGLSDRDIMVLRAHLSVLPEGPIRMGEVNLSFMKVQDILKRACGMDERRFREGELNLHRAGLILRNLSSNFRRYPERDASGRIIGGYGIDLNPLLSRRTKLLALRDQLSSERRVLRQKRNSLSARFQALVRDLIATGGELPSGVFELKQKLRNALRRKSTTLADLEALDAEVAHLDGPPSPSAQTYSSVEAEDPALAEGPDSAVVDVSSATIPTPNSDNNIIRLEPTKAEGGGGGFIRHTESEPKKEIQERARSFEPYAVQAIWRSTKTLQQYYPEPPHREREAAGLLIDFSSYLGLGQQVVIKALSIFGWEYLIEVIDYIAERVDRLKHPEGYLCTMIKCFERGEPVAGGSVLPARLPRNHVAV